MNKKIMNKKIMNKKIFLIFGLIFVSALLVGCTAIKDDNSTGMFSFQLFKSSSDKTTTNTISEKTTAQKAVATQTSPAARLNLKNINFATLKSNPNLLKQINPLTISYKIGNGFKLPSPINKLSPIIPKFMTCKDDDGGKNIDKKGIVTLEVTQNGKVISTSTYTDTCKSTTRLLEYYCVNTMIPSRNNYAVKEISCDNGCANGKCLPPASNSGPVCSKDKSYVYSYTKRSGTKIISECGPLGCDTTKAQCNSCTENWKCENGVETHTSSGVMCNQQQTLCNFGCAADGKKCNKCASSQSCTADGKENITSLLNDGTCKTVVSSCSKSAEKCTVAPSIDGTISVMCLGPQCNEGISCDGNNLVTRIKDNSTDSCLVSSLSCKFGCSNNQCNVATYCDNGNEIKTQNTDGSYTTKTCNSTSIAGGCSYNDQHANRTACDCEPNVVCDIDGGKTRTVTDVSCKKTVETAPAGKYCSNGAWTSEACSVGTYCDGNNLMNKNLGSNGECAFSVSRSCSPGTCQNGQCLSPESYTCVNGVETHNLPGGNIDTKTCDAGCDGNRCKTCTPGWACRGTQKVYYQDTACTTPTNWGVYDCVTGVCTQSRDSSGYIQANCNIGTCSNGLQVNMINQSWGTSFAVVPKCNTINNAVLDTGYIDFSTGACIVGTRNCDYGQKKCGFDSINQSDACLV